MKKKLLSILILTMIIVGCVGCGNDDTMIDTNTTEVEDTVVVDYDAKENPNGTDKETISINEPLNDAGLY